MSVYSYFDETYDPSIDAGCRRIAGSGEGPRQVNRDPSLVLGSDGTLLVAWTQSSLSRKDEGLVCAWSSDGARSWSEPVVIERGEDGRTASSVALFCVPHSRRVYAFYWWNFGGSPKAHAGGIQFRFSDDFGRHWSDAWQVSMREHDLDQSDGTYCGWLDGAPLLVSDGAMLLGFTKIAPRGGRSRGARSTADRWASECFILRAEDILFADDPERLYFCVCPDAPAGLWTNHPEEPELHFCQDPVLALLESGRILAVMCTRTGSPYYSISEDSGLNWNPTHPLRQAPGGRPLTHNCGPCAVSSTADGRIFLLFANCGEVPAENGRDPEAFWLTRDPLHVCVGREMPALGKIYAPEENNASIYFDHPRILLAGVEDSPKECPTLDKRYPWRTANDPILCHWAGQHLIAYSNADLELRLKPVPDLLLSPLGLPWAEKGLRVARNIRQTMRLPRTQRFSSSP